MELMDHMLIAKARKLAEQAHSGQLDKAGAPYLGHVRRVADRCEGSFDVAVAWLHDVLEDTDWSEYDLMAGGMPQEIIDSVRVLTHRRNEPRADYYARILSDERARRVKLADIADNSDPARLAELDGSTRERLERKYAAAREALAP